MSTVAHRIDWRDNCSGKEALVLLRKSRDDHEPLDGGFVWEGRLMLAYLFGIVAIVAALTT